MIFTQAQYDTLDQAIATWGLYEQKQMAVGECGEFLALYGKEVQGRALPEHYHDEIADVMIMMEQMAKIYGYEQVLARKEYKMARLQVRIDDYNNENGI